MKILSQDSRMNSPSFVLGKGKGSLESVQSQETTDDLLIMLLKENMSLKKKNKELNQKMNLYEQIIFEDHQVISSKVSILHAEDCR